MFSVLVTVDIAPEEVLFLSNDIRTKCFRDSFYSNVLRHIYNFPSVYISDVGEADCFHCETYRV